MEMIVGVGCTYLCMYMYVDGALVWAWDAMDGRDTKWLRHMWVVLR